MRHLTKWPRHRHRRRGWSRSPRSPRHRREGKDTKHMMNIDIEKIRISIFASSFSVRPAREESTVPCPEHAFIKTLPGFPATCLRKAEDQTSSTSRPWRRGEQRRRSTSLRGSAPITRDKRYFAGVGAGPVGVKSESDVHAAATCK